MTLNKYGFVKQAGGSALYKETSKEEKHYYRLSWLSVSFKGKVLL